MDDFPRMGDTPWIDTSLSFTVGLAKYTCLQPVLYWAPGRDPTPRWGRGPCLTWATPSRSTSRVAVAIATRLSLPLGLGRHRTAVPHASPPGPKLIWLQLLPFKLPGQQA
eukprot:3735-Pelagomonas_calceolata.AAC.1